MAAVKTMARYRWVILGISLMCQATAALAGQVLAPLAPLFQPELGLTKAEVGLFSSATFAGAWAVILIAGTVTDRFGIRRMMTLGQLATGVLLLTMSSVVSAFQAAAVMFAAGLGRGTVFPGSTKAIMEWFPPATRATAMGIKQTGAPLAGIVTASTLPALALTIGWRSAIAVAGLAIILGGVVTALLYRDPGGSPRKREAAPGMRAGLKDVAGNRRLWIVSVMAMLFVMSQQSLITYLALYFKEVVLVPLVPDEPARIVAAGGYLAICQFGGIFGRVFWGAVSDRLFRQQRLAMLAAIGSLSSMAALAVAGAESGYPPWLLTGLVFAAGATTVGWNGVYHTLVTETVGHKYAATGVGLSLTLIETGTMVGPPLFGLVADVAGTYRMGWLFLTCLSGAGTLVAALAARRDQRTEIAQ